MTIDEAKEICKKLTQLNLAIWNASSKNEKEKLREEFRHNARLVHEAGFKLKKWRDNGMPMFAPRVNRHLDDMQFEDNRPDGVDLKNDCTTRCISFCTGIKYEDIKAEQLEYARKSGESWATWRHLVIWEKCLLARGFVALFLDKRRISRATFLKMSKTLPVHEGKIATVSSGHVAAIDMASRKVLDTWNSSGGRILKIYVPEKFKNTYYIWLKSIGCCV